MKKRIHLRKAVWEDGELLFSWANDIDVRRNALQQHEISWDEHTAWLKKKLQDADCRIYIACIQTTDVSERPVGQLRLDVEDGTAEIDYSIAAELRGQGYGTALVRQAEREAGTEIRRFSARVKKGNPASARVFEKCGFALCGEDDACYLFTKEHTAEPAPARPAIVICTCRSWNIAYAERMRLQYEKDYDITVITDKKDLTREAMDAVRPKYIFFPHWSYLIPESVFGAYPCIVFHMTDLPYGRGGSPLQNLIVRGHTHTKLSALRAGSGIDTGDIYQKADLDLSGTAEEILRRASGIIFTEMIPDILENNPLPVPQSGAVTTFRRRKPEDGRLLPEMDEKTIYDFIRMLDGEGYPNAFVEIGPYVLRFREAAYADGRVTARVTFEKRKEEKDGL